MVKLRLNLYQIERNPNGAYNPNDIVDVLVDVAASPTVEKHGETIKPDVN